MILTSREIPAALSRLEGDAEQVHSIRLNGLDLAAGWALLDTRGLADSGDEGRELIERYSGNPLALKLVADTSQKLFGGVIDDFLTDETPIFDDIRTVLAQQFNRLTELEAEIIFWLAIQREGTTLEALEQQLLHPPRRRELLEAVLGLQRRSLIERRHSELALQNVIIVGAIE